MTYPYPAGAWARKVICRWRHRSIKEPPEAFESLAYISWCESQRLGTEWESELRSLYQPERTWQTKSSPLFDTHRKLDTPEAISIDLSTLSPLEAEVIDRYYGLSGEEESSIDIAKDHHLPFGKVLTIRNTALEKLCCGSNRPTFSSPEVPLE